MYISNDQFLIIHKTKQIIYIKLEFYISQQNMLPCVKLYSSTTVTIGYTDRPTFLKAGTLPFTEDIAIK